jgi:capsular polysaccharide export protein
LLQGPLGPFFKDLGQELREQYGVPVYQIVLNGGDQLFAQGPSCIPYTGTVDAWPRFFTRFIREHNISTVLAYGDCRIYHAEAKRVSLLEDGVRYFAFEEGYLRPNYITLEEGGVNGHSPVRHQAVEAYRPVHVAKDEQVIGGNFFRRMCFALAYDFVSTISLSTSYRHYQHHRPLTPVATAFYWSRGFLRKLLYKITEPSSKQIVNKRDFFLVPLQVHYDAQIKFHSHYESMEDFITEAMASFAGSGCRDNIVFKHHPMDRGHVNYRRFIQKLALRLGISDRVMYIHDQHLPTLLKACKGVVTINSTTALQAFYHRAPVKTMGAAFFDMPGLTFQGKLKDFWNNPSGLDNDFSDRFRAYLLDHGQINGSFYCHSEMTINNVIHYLNAQQAIRLEINAQCDGVSL